MTSRVNFVVVLLLIDIRASLKILDNIRGTKSGEATLRSVHESFDARPGN